LSRTCAEGRRLGARNAATYDAGVKKLILAVCAAMAAVVVYKLLNSEYVPPETG
jgi:hypothetical protein